MSSRVSISAEDRLRSLSDEKSELVKLLLEGKSRETQKITPFPRDGGPGAVRLPTSWAQQRLWFIDQLEGRSEAYHIALALRLNGTLNESALQKALDNLVGRHEALRTVFVNANGEPMQEIKASEPFTLHRVDLSAYEPAERDAQMQLHKAEEARERFDLLVGPLIRGRLLRVHREEHVLLITMHHIISDGWSMGVLTRELAQLYRAHLEYLTDPLAPLSVQYVDYALWQRQWLRGPLRDHQLAYWRERLQGAAAQLELPTDRPRPTLQTFRGDNLDIVLDAQLTAELRALSQRHGMTLFMVLYAGWAILLSRLSGQEDVVIGTPVANRQQPELEGLIGFFVNTLALRANVQTDLTLERFLLQVKQLTLSAYGHQDVPFEQIVEALQPERNLNRNPIFQVMLALQTAPKEELRLPGLTCTVEPETYEFSMFDLMFSLEEHRNEIIGRLNYSTDLFDQTTVERWLASFSILLQGMTGGERRLLADLPILTPCESQQVSKLFNASHADYPCDKTIQQLFEEQVVRAPAAVAVEYAGRSLTYAELNKQANRLARYLRGRGVGLDQAVAVCLPRTLEMVAGLLGIIKAGAAYMPLDPHYPRERLQYMLEDAVPAQVLTHSQLRSVLPVTAAEQIVLDDCKELGAQIEGDLPTAELGLSPTNLVYVIYTSGSTGRPKGTAMSHHSMVNLIEWHRQHFCADMAQRVLQFATLSFDVAFQEIFTTLCTGGTLVLLDEWLRRDPRALMEFMSKRSITRLFVPPLMLQSVAEYCQSAGAVPDALQDVVCAGEQLRITPEIKRLFKRLPGCRLHNHYGPTETHVVTALTLSGEPDHWPVFPAIGRPIANAQIYILDAQRNPVPIGVSGEIYIGGRAVARGYLNRPELTAQRFVADPFSIDPHARLYKTGDLGRWRADAALEYLGRNDDQVKIRGFRIELGEIETQLARHEGVRDTAVVVREDAPGEKQLVAYVTYRSERTPRVEELRAHLQDLLPEHMMPTAFVALETLPLTPSGKLDRRALPTPPAKAYASRSYEAPQGEMEERLAAIWQDLLRVERIGRHDNFFQLGGHSLLGMKLVARIAEQFLFEVPVMAMFRHPTIRQMAAMIQSLPNGAPTPHVDPIQFEDGVL